MYEPRQLNLSLATTEQLKLVWAFVDKKRQVLTSCSPTAKQLGVNVGMRYQDAKELLPEMRVIMLGGRNARIS